MTDSSLTATDLIATASQTLIGGHYTQIVRTFPAWDTATSRLFEDEYSVVGVTVFDTCGELVRMWPDLQGSLVDLISKRVGHEEAKAWDGYLVLLSPGIAPSESSAINSIRYNTVRLRKLVGTGDELHRPADVERVLRPLLPFGPEQASLNKASALDLLPGLLAPNGIPESTTAALVNAFKEQAPMLERLHRMRGES